VPTLARPFFDVAPLLRQADVALGNLETPMGDQPDHLLLTPTRTGRTPEAPGFSLNFRADPADAALLVDGGFTHLSSANNHILDMGAGVALATREHLAAAGLVGLGFAASTAEADAPVVIDEHGVRVALLARTVWTKGHPPEGPGWGMAYVRNRDLADELAAEVTRVKADTHADFLVLFIHWGWEYEPAPRDAQETAARALVAAGADVIIGHHPHVVQRFERAGQAVIAYSVGNFLFDQPLVPTRRSVIVDLTLDAGAHTIGATLHPVIIDEDTRTPRRPRGAAYRAWAGELKGMAPGFRIAAEPGKGKGRGKGRELQARPAASP
jgi:poly-gamma-glutamate synthesis protein (capsule biosynthesis protein)